MKNTPIQVQNVNGWLYASLPLTIARRTVQVALLSVFVAGAGTASAGTVTAVGAVTTQSQYFGTPGYSANIPPATWGQTTTQTYYPGDPEYDPGDTQIGPRTISVGAIYDDFRSTDTLPKAYVLPGNPNVYGQDGYAFYGVSVVNGPSLGNLVSDPTYISNITLNPASLSQSVISGGFGYMDNPTLAPAPYVSTDTVAYGVVRTTGTADGSTDPVLSFTLSSAKTFRVGIMTGDGNNAKPLSLTLSTGSGMSLVSANVTATGITGGNSYLYPDWYFFDVTGTAGEVFTLSLENSGPSGNDQTSFSGLVFDSVATPEPATWALLGVSLSMLFVLARRNSLSKVS